MKMTAKKKIGTIVTVIACLMIAAGALSQIAGVKTVADSMTKAGVGDYYRFLGGLKLVFLVLYLYPKTFRLGFLLLCCFFGGAMATLLSHHESFVPPAIPLTILWIATYLRDKSVFLSNPLQSHTAL